MKRPIRAIVVAALMALTFASSAAAHAGNPNFRSVFQSIYPPAPGLKVQVIGYDSQMQITNHTGKTVVIEGYDNEPYARLLPDGTVQVNKRSPANYLNQDVYARVTVPASANAKAPPQWQTLDKTAQFIWHDHRMHFMSTATPRQVKDSHKKTKIFSYQIPLKVGSQPTNINGTLYWVGPAGGGFPAWAGISLAVLLLLLVAIGVRRRRRSPSARVESKPESAEAW